MMRLRVEFACGACATRPDDQPNHCPKCGGSGVLETMVSVYQLSRMGDIPTTVRGIVWPRPAKKKRGVRV